ncbi:MFS transporter [Paenibacillus lactis]|uniref:MFS transporter n=1 Tax=Paenibacillus lactis TaxID=228574 RepID=UPI00203E3505|nr:MFS transporter [Paenibacillus lactis]MCM3492200.1 MFS transporter [Paenibacillus lactis]
MIGGLLPTLAAALHVSTALAGQLVTAFSLVYAVTSPLLTTLAGRMERRTLLFGSLLLLAVGNVVCGFASSYGWMLTGRIVAALGAGLFSPGAVAAASTLAAPEKRGRAVSIVVAGQTVSLILGVPFGTWVALTFDWRMTFWIVGGVTLLAALAIQLQFPRVAPAGAVGMRERLSYLKQPELLSALLTTLAWATGIFSLFTYVSELFAGYGAGGRMISVVLCLTGIASFIGVRTGGHRRGPDRPESDGPAGADPAHGLAIPSVGVERLCRPSRHSRTGGECNGTVRVQRLHVQSCAAASADRAVRTFVRHRPVAAVFRPLRGKRFGCVGWWSRRAFRHRRGNRLFRWRYAGDVTRLVRSEPAPGAA